MATIKQRIDTVTDNVIGGKSDIASAITDIGVPATSAETFNSLANKIKQTQDGKYELTLFGKCIYLNSNTTTINGIRRFYDKFEHFYFPVSKTKEDAPVIADLEFVITNGVSFNDYVLDLIVDTFDWDEESVPNFLKLRYYGNTGMYISYDGSTIPDNKIYKVLCKPLTDYDDDDPEIYRRYFYITFRNENAATSSYN